MQTLSTSPNTQPVEDPILKTGAGTLLPSRRALAFLFLALLALNTYAAPRWNDWNQNSRLSLVRALVERGTVQVDVYQSTTGDYAFYNGHYYSDKPPGPALVGVIPYYALNAILNTPPGQKLVDSLSQSPSFSRTFSEGTNYGESDSTPRDKIIGALGRILLSLLVIAIPVALMACLFWRWACEITGRYWLSLGLTLALLLGTTLFPYSSLYYNHALTAALLFSGFYLLYRLKGQKGSSRQLAFIGFLLGFSLISQYETILIAAPLGLYALVTTTRPNWLHRLLWLVLGALPSALAMIAYDLVAFGTPMPVGYQYSTLWMDRHSQGFMSLTYPHLDALWGLSFSPYRGIFLLSPFLLLALPGFIYGIRRTGYRLEAAFCLWSGVAFFLFNASSVMWWGGHAFGPRYLVTSLPFVTFGVALFLREACLRHWRGVALWFGLPALCSVLVVLPASLVGRQWPTEDYASPLTDYLWPQLLSGNFAPNPGMALGLKGLVSYLPLLVVVGLVYLSLFYRPWRFSSAATTRLSMESGTNNITLESSIKAEKPQEMQSPVQNERRNWWRTDFIFVLASIGLLLLFTSLPYLFGYLRAPADKRFMGIMLDVPDTTQYWAWMREMQHNWLISNPLTSEANDPVFFNLLWGVLGRFQGISGWSQEWIYQLFRIFSIVFCGTISWHFCKFMFVRPIVQRVSFILIMFGSGWGWISILIKQFTGTLSNPLSVFVAEPNIFQSALAFPHLIFSTALLLSVFLLAFRAVETVSLKWAVAAGLVALLLGLEHAYDLVIVYGILGSYWLLTMIRSRRFNWLWFKVLLVTGLISAGPPIYFVYITTVNATWKGVLAQYGNAGVFTPDPLNLLILIGPLLLVAIVGLWQKPSKEASPVYAERSRFLKTWFVVGFFLLYIPTNFQIKMMNGWQIPVYGLAVLTMGGMVQGWLSLRLPRWFKTKRLELVLYLLAIAIALPTSFYIFSWRFLDLNRTAQSYYLYKDEVAAIDWIVANSSPAIVVSSEDLGQYLAARTPDRPFLAHWAMTLDFYTKRKLTAEVLNPKTTPERREAILKEYRVKFVLYGAAEKQLAPALVDPRLHKVFTTVKADVYEVLGDD